MKSHYNIIIDQIKKYSCCNEVVFVSGCGNWGDAVIRMGTLNFFFKNHIPFIEIPYRNIVNKHYKIDRPHLKEQFKEKILVFGGGGAWCSWYKTAYTFIRDFHIYFSHIIVLPSTFEFYFDAENIIYFSRDNRQSLENNPKAIFCHDMAFYLDDLYFPKKPYIKNGYFFRTDRESKNEIAIPNGNKDISLNGNELTSIENFITTINQYQNVYTDRLHVAIVAALLGKKIFLFQGRYFKNEAVYWSSLKDNFSNITFIEEQKESFVVYERR